MRKKYIIRLTKQEREQLEQLTKTLNGSSLKVRRAHILLMSDADGPCWPDARIAEAYRCRVQTIEQLRERCVTHGFAAALHGQPRTGAPRAKILSGKQEAQVIALRLGPPPPGFGHWTLRLVAERVVELHIVEAISYETVRRTLKKTA